MLYVHIPFCHRKCNYCAFYSRPVKNADGVDCMAYIEALEREMIQRPWPRPVQTLYIGGGTPSLLPLPALARLSEALHRHYDLSQLQEATIEANPEDLSPAYLVGLAELHLFNRISIGIQTLDDGQLHLLGRRHTAAQALAAVAEAHSVGLHNISVDFMYGLPAAGGANGFLLPPASLLQQVEHVSAYCLTVEPGTALEHQLKQHRFELPIEEEQLRQYYALHSHLEAHGFRQYEVSNYARPGHHSRHNSRYWNHTPYLGLGAAAHSFDGKCRRWNVSDTSLYIATLAYDEEYLTAADLYNELLMTSLRTVHGLPLQSVGQQHLPNLLREVQPYLRRGLLRIEDGCLRPTQIGLLQADGIAAALFAEQV